LKNPLIAYKAGFFQGLAHPTRIAIIEMLREGELSCCALKARLGVEQSNLSQHLAVLRSRQLVDARKDGQQVFYSVRNPILFEILDILRRYYQTHLNEAIQVLREVEAEEARQ